MLISVLHTIPLCYSRRHSRLRCSYQPRDDGVSLTLFLTTPQRSPHYLRTDLKTTASLSSPQPTNHTNQSQWYCSLVPCAAWPVPPSPPLYTQPRDPSQPPSLAAPQLCDTTLAVSEQWLINAKRSRYSSSCTMARSTPKK